MPPPLAGIQVLDLSRMAPGPFCTMLLADLGADVIKVEQPGYGVIPLDVDQETWAAYFALDRNKRSILLDLKSVDGREVFYGLAKTADVVLEGFRPGVVKQLRVDYETLKPLSPRIVYCSLSGYGQDGPYRDLPGHDINYVAVGGALGAMAIRAGRPAVPLNLIGDYAGGGLQAAFAIVVALLARDRAGTGQYIDVSMLDGAVSLLSWEASLYFASGGVPRWGETVLTGGVPCSSVYETSDGGFIALGCFEVGPWQNLCRALGREDLVPYQFATGDEKERIYSELRQIFLTKEKNEWFEMLRTRDVAVAPVHELDEVFLDPQVVHRGMVVDVEHPRLGKVRQVGIGPKFSETPGEIRSTAPVPGQHTEEIVAGLGYSEGDIRRLREAGAIG
jgi:crotonobetainyl-CoA:carnitine CoA-transferase CaiB-like acyl-CoA transferase